METARKSGAPARGGAEFELSSARNPITTRVCHAVFEESTAHRVARGQLIDIAMGSTH